jgi:hypothetical protein
MLSGFKSTKSHKLSNQSLLKKSISSSLGDAKPSSLASLMAADILDE